MESYLKRLKELEELEIEHKLLDELELETDELELEDDELVAQIGQPSLTTKLLNLALSTYPEVIPT